MDHLSIYTLRRFMVNVITKNRVTREIGLLFILSIDKVVRQLQKGLKYDLCLIQNSPVSLCRRM